MSIEQNSLAMKSGDVFPKMDEIEQITERLGKGNLFADEHVQILFSRILTLEAELRKGPCCNIICHAEKLQNEEKVKELQFNFNEMVNVASEQTEAWRQENKKVKTLMSERDSATRWAIEYSDKLKELETDDKRKSEKFMEIIDKYESLKFKMFDLEEQLRISREAHADTISGQAQRIKELEGAIDKHEKFKKGREKVVELVDEELYGVVEKGREK